MSPSFPFLPISPPDEVNNKSGVFQLSWHDLPRDTLKQQKKTKKRGKRKKKRNF